MKKYLLPVCMALLLSGFSAHGQAAVKHEPALSLKEIPALNSLLEEIRLKEASIATMSRSGAAEANSELRELYEVYSAAIAEEIGKATSETILTGLNRELTYAEQRKAELSLTH